MTVGCSRTDRRNSKECWLNKIKIRVPPFSKASGSKEDGSKSIHLNSSISLQQQEATTLQVNRLMKPFSLPCCYKREVWSVVKDLVSSPSFLCGVCESGLLNFFCGGESLVAARQKRTPARKHRKKKFMESPCRAITISLMCHSTIRLLLSSVQSMGQ